MVPSPTALPTVAPVTFVKTTESDSSASAVRSPMTMIVTSRTVWPGAKVMVRRPGFQTW